MEMDTYQHLAMRTASHDTWKTQEGKLLTGALGVCGESGEIAELVKKHIYHGHDLDAEKVIKEIGDVLWYCALLATAVNADLSEVALRNIEKLRKRYPEGFQTELSVNKDEAKE